MPKFYVVTKVKQCIEANSPAEAFLQALVPLQQLEEKYSNIKVGQSGCTDDEGGIYEEVDVFKQCLAWAQNR